MVTQEVKGEIKDKTNAWAYMFLSHSTKFRRLTFFQYSNTPILQYSITPFFRYSNTPMFWSSS